MLYGEYFTVAVFGEFLLRDVSKIEREAAERDKKERSRGRKGKEESKRIWNQEEKRRDVRRLREREWRDGE